MSPHIAPETHVGRVALRVNDLDRVVEFYSDVVGLAVLTESETAATLGAGGRPFLELTTAPDLPERGRTETGLFHTAFRVPTREALGDALHRVENQWRLSGASDHLVSEALYLNDPEGNGIEIYTDRPRETWERDEDGELLMDTLPLDLGELRELGDTDSTVPDGTDVGHIHLEVSSIPATREFYEDAVGLDSPVALPAPYGGSSLFVSAGGYHHHIGANTWNGRTDPPSGRGLDWFELVVPDEAALAAVRDQFDTAGVDVAEADGELHVHDPNGIELRIRTE
ncbi:MULTISPECIES: VOC family protein [unclassified Haladaptatus]|uniref:VOC family protein n=1 Tax=unclassified Haladaptatus TaxID=2622732 RepID=UPI0023E8A26C|nr:MULTISPECIES: VOC family protein [unclassified Haladaptatus]